MFPSNVMRIVTYVVGVAVFVGGLLGVQLGFLTADLPDFLNSVWVAGGVLITAGRGLYDMIKDAIKNRGGSFLPFEE